VPGICAILFSIDEGSVIEIYTWTTENIPLLNSDLFSGTYPISFRTEFISPPRKFDPSKESIESRSTLAIVRLIGEMK
jgi:hypothetical protein